jgi:hypothetical protein
MDLLLAGSMHGWDTCAMFTYVYFFAILKLALLKCPTRLLLAIGYYSM